jgi:tetratricopeptide (TPR) repeat protein
MAALVGGLFEEMTTGLDRAAEVAERLGNRRLLCRSLGDRAFNAVLLLHDFAEAFRLVDEGMRIADELGDNELRFFLGVVAVEAYEDSGRFEERDELWARLADLAPGIRDRSALWMWAFSGAFPMLHRGEFADALRHVDRWQHNVHDRGGRIGLMWTRGLALTGAGVFAAAQSVLLESLHLAEQSGDQVYQVRILNSLGWLFAEMLDAVEALGWNERSVTVAEALELPDAECEFNARLNAADNLMTLGRVDEARPHLARVERAVREQRPDEELMRWRWTMHLHASASRLHLLDGDAPGALALADECLAEAVASRSGKYQSIANRRRGAALAAMGDEAGAEAARRDALRSANDVGSPSERWRCHAALGDVEAARTALDELAAAVPADRRARFVESAAAILAGPPSAIP